MQVRILSALTRLRKENNYENETSRMERVRRESRKPYN